MKNKNKVTRAELIKILEEIELAMYDSQLYIKFSIEENKSLKKIEWCSKAYIALNEARQEVESLIKFKI